MDGKKKLKFIFIVSAFAVLILIVLSNVFKMTQVTERDFKTYRQGLYYLEKKDLENAYYNFLNVSKTSAIYEVALLRQAICADELNDFSTASKKYKLFIEKYPDSIFLQKAYYALGQNHFKEKDLNKAEKTFFDIKRLFKDSEYKIASDYYLGLIYLEKLKVEKNDRQIKELKLKAKNAFVEYIVASPGGRFSVDCANNIKKLAIDLTVQEHLDLGIVYFKNGLYKESLQELEQVGVEHSWTYLSLANKKLGFYKKSMSIFENNYPKYSDNIDEELLWNVIDNYVSIYSGDKKNALYKVLNMAQLNSSKAQDYILYCLCKYVDDKTKQELYRKIYIDFPDGKFASDALANLFWQAYQAKDYKEAKMLGQIHIRDYGGTIASPKVLFWLARLTEKQGHKSEAKSLYQRLIEKYPDDYYAYRANSYLSFGTMSKGSWHTKTSYKLPEKQVIEFPAKFAEVSDDNIKLIENILNLNDYKLLGEIDKNNKIVLSWINYREGNYSTSTLLARDAIAKMQSKPPFSDNIYKLVYPLHYQSVISEQAKINKLDPYLVLALIREESYFNPEAQSNAGARGLMQIMPSTASFIATHSNSTYSGPASLSIPDINIRLGCAYLKYAKKALEKDVLAIASYNGGPGAVNQWKNSLKYISWDEFVENIPYPETREYVKKVFRSYWVYLNVYNIANRL